MSPSVYHFCIIGLVLTVFIRKEIAYYKFNEVIIVFDNNLYALLHTCVCILVYKWVIYKHSIFVCAMFRTINSYDWAMFLKLVRTPLNVYFAAFKIIFLSLYAPIYFVWTSCLISFAWDQSTCHERVESDKIQNEKVLPTVGLEPTILRLEV